VIIEVDGKQVSDSSEFRERLREYTPGDKIPMKVRRKEVETVLDVYAIEIPVSRSRELAWDLLGLQVIDLTAQQIQERRLYVDKGVLVQSVRPGSPSEEVGIKPGDVIIQIDRTQVGKVKHFYTGIRQSLHRDSATIVVVRKANAYRVTLEIQ